MKYLKVLQFLLTLSFIQGALIGSACSKISRLVAPNAVQYYNPSESVAVTYSYGIDI